MDLGAGTGALSLRLAPKVRRVIARDISEQMLKVAREKAQKKKVKNIDFDFGSFSEPNCGEKVDIVSNLAFHHLTDEEKRKAIRVWYGLLKPGGGSYLVTICGFSTTERIRRERKESSGR